MRRLTFGLAVVTLFGMAEPQPLVAQQEIEAAQTAFRTGRYDDAISSFRRLLRQDASSVETARGLVRALSEIGDYDAALEVALVRSSSCFVIPQSHVECRRALALDDSLPERSAFRATRFG